MESQKIKALMKSVNCGSLTKAAEELGYTQAGLTHMMNRLESEVGISLLQRDKNGVKLTFEGKRLLPYMKDFLVAGERLEKKMSEIAEETGEVIRIGTYTSILKLWLPGIINSFKEENPGTSIEIRDNSLDNIYNWVSMSELDLAFASKQEYQGCRFIHLCNDPLYAVLPKSYAIDSTKPTVPISMFNGSSFIMPTFGFDRDVLSALNNNSVKPIMNTTSVNDAAVTSLVEIGLGVSILPELVLKSIDTSGVMTKPLEPSCYRDLGIIVSLEKTKSPLVKKFIRYSEQYIKNMYQ